MGWGKGSDGSGLNKEKTEPNEGGALNRKATKVALAQNSSQHHAGLIGK